MSELIEDIRKPISEGAPCGVDIKYDDDYGVLRAEMYKMAEQDWDRVVTLAHTILARKSKDLNTATYLCIDLLRLRGFDGLADGLEGYRILLQEYWDDLYPRSCRARANALRMLISHLGGNEKTLGLIEARQATSNDVDALQRIRDTIDALNIDIKDKFPSSSLSLSNVAQAIEDKLQMLQPKSEPPQAPAPIAQEAIPEARQATSNDVDALQGIAVRNLLSELRVHVITNRQFRRALENIVNQPESAMRNLESLIDLVQRQTIPRYSYVSFPNHTVVEQTEALRVAITVKPINERAVELPLEPPPDKAEPMRVDVLPVISPLDFNLESPSVQTIEVPLDTDSAPVIFKLVPKSEGRKIIAVEFFQNTRYLGRAELETTVSREVQASCPAPTQATLSLGPSQPPDLTILFDRVDLGNGKHYYRYKLLSHLRELNLYFEEFHTLETDVKPEGLLEEIIAQLNRGVSNKRLNSIGVSLYNRLFPNDLKRLY